MSAYEADLIIDLKAKVAALTAALEDARSRLIGLEYHLNGQFPAESITHIIATLDTAREAR